MLAGDQEILKAFDDFIRSRPETALEILRVIAERALRRASDMLKADLLLEEGDDLFVEFASDPDGFEFEYTTVEWTRHRNGFDTERREFHAIDLFGLAEPDLKALREAAQERRDAAAATAKEVAAEAEQKAAEERLRRLREDVENGRITPDAARRALLPVLSAGVETGELTKEDLEDAAHAMQMLDAAKRRAEIERLSAEILKTPPLSPDSEARLERYIADVQAGEFTTVLIVETNESDDSLNITIRAKSEESEGC